MGQEEETAIPLQQGSDLLKCAEQPSVFFGTQRTIWNESQLLGPGTSTLYDFSQQNTEKLTQKRPNQLLPCDGDDILITSPEQPRMRTLSRS